MARVLFAAVLLVVVAQAHTYTYTAGALLAGDDVSPPANLTLPAAEVRCSANKACIGVTFKSATKLPSGVVKAYFKGGSTQTNGADPVGLAVS